MSWYRSSSRFILHAFRRRYSSKTTTSAVAAAAAVSKRPHVRSFSQKASSSVRSYNYSRTYEDIQIRAKRFCSENHEEISCSIFLIGCGFVITLSCGSKETVPYTKRSRFVLLSPSFEKKIGESAFKVMKEEKKEKILAPSHLLTVRVSQIAQRIIETVKSQATAMEGLKWEVIVVDDPETVNACCLPGGKIVVFTGLLAHFTEDAEIATIIGHEVGHAVARHFAEKIHKIVWWLIIRMILYQFFDYNVSYATSTICLELPHSRRMEMEADYIGLVLMSWAGYDPRVAPKTYDKMGKIGGRRASALGNYLSTHPSGDKRSKQLSQPKVMKEALSIYKDAVMEKHDDQNLNKGEERLAAGASEIELGIPENRGEARLAAGAGE